MIANNAYGSKTNPYLETYTVFVHHLIKLWTWIKWTVTNFCEIQHVEPAIGYYPCWYFLTSNQQYQCSGYAKFFSWNTGAIKNRSLKFCMEQDFLKTHNS